MRIVAASFKIESPIDGVQMLKNIEEAGRICYQTDHKITEDSYLPFVERLLKRGHMSVVEHEYVRVRFIVDRGITHEIVRHRLASYSQESTRFCNYSKERFGNEIAVIDLSQFMTEEQYRSWEKTMAAIEAGYFELLELGAKAQIARSVLPNCLKTEIVMTCNLREWIHFFTMRAADPAHPQMREVACPLLREFRSQIPILFDNVGDPECETPPTEGWTPEGWTSEGWARGEG